MKIETLNYLDRINSIFKTIFNFNILGAINTLFISQLYLIIIPSYPEYLSLFIQMSSIYLIFFIISVIVISISFILSFIIKNKEKSEISKINLEVKEKL